MQSLHYNDASYQELVHQKWENFINHIDDDYSMIRPEVIDSWTRSRNADVNPHKLVNKFLAPEELNIKLNSAAELLTIVRPYMKRIYSIVKGTGAYILISDREGYILDVIGDKDIVYEGQSYSKLVIGACRKEQVAGTNAVGTTLFLDTPTQLWGEEHYIEWHKPFACAGAPFYDENNNLLGSFTVTCKKEFAHPHTLGMVSCAADSITREIKLKSTMDKLEMLSSQRNLMLENMTAGVFLLSAEGRISQVNSIALNMLGLQYEETIGRDIFDLISFHSGSDTSTLSTFLSAECYNLEANVQILAHGSLTKRFNISINHIKNYSDEITGILLRINKPEVIQKLVKRIEGHHAKYYVGDIIGESQVMKNLKRDCLKIAGTESNILILGPSGTGKELVAQSIHNASSVSDGPFVAINCAAIPNNLVESELFGYERGAFTGAAKEGRPGKFELADGGTIFLDEIGDMPLDVQATLLRVLQTKEVIRIGGSSPRPVNIRVIAATNQDLLTAIQEKTFRSDLYYRLNVFTIYTPSLKERGPEDICLLADYFVTLYNSNKGKSLRISPDVYPILQEYDWPGNVRQLENVIERAINLTDDNLITPEHLPEHILHRQPAPEIMLHSSGSMQPAAPSAYNVNFKEFPSAVDNEKSLIISALVKTKGKITDTAELLDMNRRTLYRRMDKLGIDPTQYRRR